MEHLVQNGTELMEPSSQKFFPKNNNLLLKLAAIELSSARTEPFEINFGNHIYERVLEGNNKIDPPTDNDSMRQKQIK
jgi:hypothetical protein